MHAVAQAELVLIWVLWAWPYLFRAPKVQKRPSITVAGPSRLGLLLETLGIWCVWWFRAPDAPRSSVFVLVAALIAGALADFLMWNAITHLGRQFRIQAGLYEDHKLVRSGPYALVRHPIYASLLWLTLATGLLLSPWQWLLAGLALCVGGNEIRVRTEDRLLESRFGKEFQEYRNQVAAYLPFVR